MVIFKLGVGSKFDVVNGYWLFSLLVVECVLVIGYFHSRSW
jgi:hypothetical protein